MTEHKHGSVEPTIGGTTARPTANVSDDPEVSQHDVAADPARIATPAGLARAREARGLPVADVAARLRMQVRQIEALEAGRWDELPGAAFVRGAIRSYARYLGQDAGPLLETITPPDTGVDLRHRMRRSSASVAPIDTGREPGGIRRWGLAVIGLFAVIAIAFHFAPSGDRPWPARWLDGDEVQERTDEGSALAGAAEGRETGAPGRGADEGGMRNDAVAAATRAASELLGTGPAAASAATPRPGVATSPAQARPAADAAAADGDSEERTAAAPVADEREAPAAPRADEPAATEARRVEPAGSAREGSDTESPAPRREIRSKTPATGTAAATPAGTTESLVMRFAAECWVEISDARGKRLVYGLQRAGTSLSLDVAGPVSVLIGNSDAVTLLRGGQAVDVKAAARDGVARLRLE